MSTRAESIVGEELDSIPAPAPRHGSSIFSAKRMSFLAWKQKTADELRALARSHLPKGKRRRSWKHKAWDLLSCGRMAEVLQCRGCGDLMKKSAAVRVGCGLRICPLCARRRANLLRVKLGRLYAHGERPRHMGLYLLTFTLRYDPSSEDDVSVDGLQRRKATVRAGFASVWRRYLKPRSRAAVCAIEVSPRGAVHAHVLYHGRRPDIATVRCLWLEKVSDSPQVNVRYVHSPSKGILEVAKYVTKGASPVRPGVFGGAPGEFTDPALAARVEVAFAGGRLVECYGAWRGADDDTEDPEHYDGAACTRCGLIGEWDWVSMATADLARALGDSFRPRFTRCGTGPPRSRKQRRTTNERSSDDVA